ncbi:MAG: leucine-rich repeat domain-containing protein [Candidatus Heimdallarchaeota archaeon]|nr:leucine-rich repeat domain-containing protein [Candidatus Heimdallarchaeota archaeon]
MSNMEIDFDKINRELLDELELLHGRVDESWESLSIVNIYNPDENSLDFFLRNIRFLPVITLNKLGIKKLIFEYELLIDEVGDVTSLIDDIKSYEALEEVRVIGYNYEETNYSDYVHIFRQFNNIKRLDLTDDLTYPTEIVKALPNLEVIFISGDTQIITRDFFGDLHNLKELYFTESWLEYIEPGSFDDLINLEILCLHSNNLGKNSLPDGLFDKLINLRELDLADNRFEDSLPIKLFDKLENLVSLDLYNNCFESLASESLYNLKKLEFLKVSFCYKPPDRFLQGLINLKFIEIHCEIGEFPVDYFTHLHGLEVLKLPECELIVPPVLKNKNLKELNLSGNKFFMNYTDNDFNQFPDGYFDHLINLKSLKVGKLGSLHELTFYNNTKLENLNLELYSRDPNLVFMLPSGIFDNLHNLQNLSMRIDKMKALPCHIFKPLSNLISLSIQSDGLQNIPPCTFKNNLNLKKLTIWLGNKYELKDGLFSNIHNLEHLDIKSVNLKNMDYDLPSPDVNKLVRVIVTQQSACYFCILKDELELDWSEAVRGIGNSNREGWGVISVIHHPRDECRQDHKLHIRKDGLPTCQRPHMMTLHYSMDLNQGYFDNDERYFFPETKFQISIMDENELNDKSDIEVITEFEINNNLRSSNYYSPKYRIESKPSKLTWT